MGEGEHISRTDKNKSFDKERQDRIIMGAERKTHYIDPKVKKMTAYHEVGPTIYQQFNSLLTRQKGGHALVALYTEGAMPLHKVTCVTRGHSLGLVCVSWQRFLHLSYCNVRRHNSFPKMTVFQSPKRNTKPALMLAWVDELPKNSVCFMDETVNCDR